MEFTGSGSKRAVTIDGETYLMPRSVEFFMKSGKHRLLRMQAIVGNCGVNGTKCSKRVVVYHVRPAINKQTILALRALREALMPMSGPEQLTIHKVIAALILRAFEAEHAGGAGILDTDVVSVRCKRHVYVRESRYLARELRQINASAEISRMTDGFLEDAAVTSGTLEPAPPATAKPESAAVARSLLDAGVVAKKTKRVRHKLNRLRKDEEGASWMLPWGIYNIDLHKHVLEGQFRRLRMMIFLGSRSFVQGKAVSRILSIKHTILGSTKNAVLALRAVRDELFPVEAPARNKVHPAVAAVVLRAFDEEYPDSGISDETVVVVHVYRHGYTTETSFVAGDLRTANLNELDIMHERFMNDPTVISGALEPAPPELVAAAAAAAAAEAAAAVPSSSGPEPRGSDDLSVTPCEREGVGKRVCGDGVTPPVAAATVYSDAGVVGKRQGRSKAEAFRVVSGDGGVSFSLPWGIFSESGNAGGEATVRLKMKLGAVRLNGEECEPQKKVTIVGGVAVTARNITALRSVRDELALGLGSASAPMRTIVAAAAFRAWTRRRKGAVISDDEPVGISAAAAATEPAAGGMDREFSLSAGVLRAAIRDRARVVRNLLSGMGDGKSEESRRRGGLQQSRSAAALAERERRDAVDGRRGVGEEQPERTAAPAPDSSAKRSKKKKRKRVGDEEKKEEQEDCKRADIPKRLPLRTAKHVGGEGAGNRSSSGSARSGRAAGQGGSEPDSVVAVAEKDVVVWTVPDSPPRKAKKKRRERAGEEGTRQCDASATCLAIETASQRAEGGVERRERKRRRILEGKVGTEGSEEGGASAKADGVIARPISCCVSAEQSQKKRKKREIKKLMRKEEGERENAENNNNSDNHRSKKEEYGTTRLDRPRRDAESKAASKGKGGESSSSRRRRRSSAVVGEPNGAPEMSERDGKKPCMRAPTAGGAGQPCVQESKSPFKSKKSQLMDWIKHG